jgi:hypothetical protein
MDRIQISNLILPWHSCETSPIEGNLFFSKATVGRKFGEGGHNEFLDRGRGENFLGCCSLIAEETTLTATQMGKEDRND